MVLHLGRFISTTQNSIFPSCSSGQTQLQSTSVAGTFQKTLGTRMEHNMAGSHEHTSCPCNLLHFDQVGLVQLLMISIFLQSMAFEFWTDLNAGSIIHKMDKNKPFDIFSVSETWLNSDILESELAISGYSIIAEAIFG